MSFVAGVAPLEAVARVARQLPVFPCRAEAEQVNWNGQTRLLRPKTPLTAHGFQEATQDLDQVRAWWRRWPQALCAVPTGGAERLVVVDYDAQKADDAAREWISAHSDELMSTRVHGTLSGGLHYIFRAPQGQSYRGGVCLTLGGARRNGIDVRAEGGYIIWWPLHGGTQTGDIAPLPAGLLDERRIEARELPPLPPHSPAKWAADRRRVIDILAYLDPEDYDQWIRAGMAIHFASGGSDDGFTLWHDWSAGEITATVPSNYAGIEDCRYRWRSFRTDGSRGVVVTLGSLVAAAKAQGYHPAPAAPALPDAEVSLPEPPDDESPPVDAYLVDEAIAAGAAIWGASKPQTDEPVKPVAHAPLDWKALEGKTPPPREWVVPDWIPAGHVTLLSGKGGIGKTLLAQQLATAIAAGKTFLTALEPRKVLMWAGEDDERELWHRQSNVCSYFEVPMGELAGNFVLHSYAGTDITLASTEYGAIIPTAGLEMLRAQVAAERPDLVILDNIARLYGGNENERHAVTTFCAWVQAACAPAAVLLLGHPAKAIGSEFSGSTAWEGAVRSRLYLGDKPPDEKDDDEDAPPTPDRFRYLCRRKANYSDEDMATLSLIEGVFVPVHADGGAAQRSDSSFCRDVVRRAATTLAERDMPPSASTASPAYLPRLAKQYGLLEGLAERQFTATMRAMILDRTLVREQVGTYPNRTPKFGLIVKSQA